MRERQTKIAYEQKIVLFIHFSRPSDKTNNGGRKVKILRIMKKINYVIALTALIAATLFAACEKNEGEIVGVNNEISTNTHNARSNKIPIEDAITELNAVLDAIDAQSSGTQGNRIQKRKREIAKIEVVYSGQFKNRANAQSGMSKLPATKEELLYIVDFEDNQGSAVLAADSRIPETVLAVTESGRILDEVHPVYEEGAGYDGNMIEDFSLYNAAEDDYYVSAAIQSSTIEYCQAYAESQIIDTFDPDYEGGSGSSNNTVARTETGLWVDVERINPKLTTVWHQRSPFNDAIPLSRWTVFHSYKRGPAGCVAIALAQIIAYHEYPANFTVNGYNIDWQGVKDICNTTNRWNDGITYNRAAVAQLVANIGAWCDMIYTPDFGFALPRKARNCISTYGYGNVVRHYGYDTSQVINMLRNDNPVFIASIPGWDFNSGHAWVLDGYINQSRTIKKYNSAGTLLSSSSETRDLIHCCFGWKTGSCNGYYVSKIFNTERGPVETESYDSGGISDSNFNWAFHIITYDNPN